MHRSTFDKLISTTGLVIAAVMFAAAAGLFFAYSFTHSQVHDQLSAEKITFPTADSLAFKALPEADQMKIKPHAGQELLTGAQAKVFADNYIAIHIEDIGSGQTYSELSEASMANPSDTALAGKVQTIFRGETLRGLLLNAYAFDTVAIIARAAAFGAIIAGAILLVLSLLGFKHTNVTKTTKRSAISKK